MLIKSKVGGAFELEDLGIRFQPGETLDLGFLATDGQLLQSKELRLALELGHLERVSGPPLVPGNFHSLMSKALPVSVSDDTSIRQALFVDATIQMDSVSYGFYVMRDLPTRRNIVTSTTDIELLDAILKNEKDRTILATARSRRDKLRRAGGGK